MTTALARVSSSSTPSSTGSGSGGASRMLALVNVFPIRDADDQAIGAVTVFRHNTDKTVPGFVAG